ncbi:MAG: hypothetical protein ACJAW2_001004, partial [Shewanella sp.]
TDLAVHVIYIVTTNLKVSFIDNLLLIKGLCVNFSLTLTSLE